MRANLSRRHFLGTSASVAGPLILPSGSLFGRKVSPNEKLNIGVIGAGGKGTADSEGVMSENIVALCDVDERTLRARKGRFPKAETFSDYRVMLEKIGDKLDAVTVSTPDHHHFPASMLAMQLGLHVYVQKPLAHNVWQAREMLKLSRKKKVITQMGNQGHSYSSTRKLVEVVRAGIIGEVKEAHVWTDRPIWPQGMDRPEGSKPVPEYLDWDLWLGAAPERPYHDGYHPFKWRGFWDFGTGALGDMGCHNMDAAFWALDLGAPTSVMADVSGVNKDTAPKWSVIRYEFPARGEKPPVSLTWYDGGKKPSPDIIGEKSLPKNGSLIVGSKATIAFREWNPNGFRVLAKGKEVNYEDPDPIFPRVGDNPYKEWINACKGGSLCLSNFEYSVPLTEMVLLGNVALRAGRKIDWDAENLKAKGHPEADQLIRSKPRKGWGI
ncbi:MAG: Gfo/Idh/MocA family oxidoreductase [Verrucomicrobiota bacterium]|nr:Gfo/Idh/MocA family oxidoreductase [Verrucomicrobiota bacterium]